MPKIDPRQFPITVGPNPSYPINPSDPIESPKNHPKNTQNSPKKHPRFTQKSLGTLTDLPNQMVFDPKKKSRSESSQPWCRKKCPHSGTWQKDEMD